MTTLHNHHLYLARVVLENRTALSLSTGFGDGIFDSELVRDVNGLPILPGTAVAGVLRHLYQRHHGEEGTNALFGTVSGEEQASRLHLSWGVMHDSQGRVHSGICFDEKRLDSDPLHGYARNTRTQPAFRDRVRLTHRGVAANEGKFDRAVLPPGFRFSLELTLWSATEDEANWQELLGLLNHPLFRLGGNTRAGLGAMKLVTLHQKHFNLKEAADAVAYRKLAADLTATEGLTPVTLPVSSTPSEVIRATLKLTPLAFWRIGQGDHSLLSEENPAHKPADLLPKLEPRVHWDEQSGRATLQSHTLLVPGSSVKGALSHRVAFHHNRFNLDSQNAEQRLADGGDYDHQENPAVQALFGSIKCNGGDKKMAGGRVGSVLIDDLNANISAKEIGTMMHNAIDRFTGGVRTHMLFEEELIWGKPIELALWVDTRHPIDTSARHALAAALEDLTSGRLALGAGAGKGHGYFEGQITWSDQGAWLNATEKSTNKENAA